MEIIQLASELGQFDPDPRRRAIAGWSMGGYGAIHYAVEHPGAFHIIGSLIGLLDFPRPADLPVGRNYTVPEMRFGRDTAVWKTFNPLERVESLRGHAMFVLTADQAFDRVMNENFHTRLDALSISHTFVVISGAHTFDVVQAALPKLVAFVSANISQ
jgi:S-formylglutathione hydrolase FrmB